MWRICSSTAVAVAPMDVADEVARNGAVRKRDDTGLEPGSSDVKREHVAHHRASRAVISESARATPANLQSRFAGNSGARHRLLR